MAPLHWSMAAKSTAPMQQLPSLGADPNVVTVEGATPIMNAAQSDKLEHLSLLIRAGADVNARDHRGFTALHRAAEKGYEAIVKVLLEHRADKTIATNGHTAFSFARGRGYENIMALLSE